MKKEWNFFFICERIVCEVLNYWNFGTCSGMDLTIVDRNDARLKNKIIEKELPPKQQIILV